MIDININDEYGNCVVLSKPYSIQPPNRKHKQRVVDCRCKCGKIFTKNLYKLLKLETRCRNCSKENHPNYIGTKHIPGTYFCHLRAKLKRGNGRKLKFLITKEFAEELLVKQNFRCTYTGRVIGFGRIEYAEENTASLDRIDSSKDYTEDNVEWVHKDIQGMKMQLSKEKFLQLVKEIYNNVEE